MIAVALDEKDQAIATLEALMDIDISEFPEKPEAAAFLKKLKG